MVKGSESQLAEGKGNGKHPLLSAATYGGNTFSSRILFLARPAVLGRSKAHNKPCWLAIGVTLRKFQHTSSQHPTPYRPIVLDIASTNRNVGTGAHTPSKQPLIQTLTSSSMSLTAL